MIHLKDKLRGIIPPLVTPLTASGTLDRAAIGRLIAHVLGGGVHGLFILGTTGEGPGLPYELRREFVTLVCREVRGRVPVLVSVTDTVLEESVRLAQHAAEWGAAAAVVAPPYYFAASQEELGAYFERLAGALPLPFYAYNIPGLTKVSLGEDVVRRCLDQPNCRGLKDSSGDLQYFKRMQRIVGATEVHSLFIGPEELLAESLLAGGDGGISGGANVWPELYIRIFAAVEAGDWVAARAAQERVMELSRRVYAIGGYGSTVTRALKAALDLAGICGPTMAFPSMGWDETARATLSRELSALGLSTERSAMSAP